MDPIHWYLAGAKAAAAVLAAGCTIIKLAQESPLTGYTLLEFARPAGIAEGVFEVMTADPAQTGHLITRPTDRRSEEPLVPLFIWNTPWAIRRQAGFKTS